MEVSVLSKGLSKGVQTTDGYFNYVQTTRPLGSTIPNFINRFFSLFTWAYRLKEINPSIISGHDLSGLIIGYIYTKIWAPKKVFLIYDSHEFELGRNAKRTRLQTAFIKQVEGFLIKRCGFSIMVNDEIAELVQDIYKLREKPVVARSTPDLWTVDSCVTASMHESLCKQLNMPTDTFIIMYHGIVTNARGIEDLIDVVAINKEVAAVILGDGDQSYINKLKQQAKQKNTEGRILFHPAVPLEELWKYVGSANVGYVFVQNVCESYKLSLPNKLLENIQSETPVICSDLVVVKKLIEHYKCGICCEIFSAEEVNKVINLLRSDQGMYRRLKNNVQKAKQDLCWEKEKKGLKEAYSKILEYVD